MLVPGFLFKSLGPIDLWNRPFDLYDNRHSIAVVWVKPSSTFLLISHVSTKLRGKKAIWLYLYCHQEGTFGWTYCHCEKDFTRSVQSLMIT